MLKNRSPLPDGGAVHAPCSRPATGSRAREPAERLASQPHEELPSLRARRQLAVRQRLCYAACDDLCMDRHRIARGEREGMNQIQLERLMSENPNRVRGSLTEGSATESLLPPFGKTLRPLPVLTLTHEAEEKLKNEMRRKCPSKITKRVWDGR